MTWWPSGVGAGGAALAAIGGSARAWKKQCWRSPRAATLYDEADITRLPIAIAGRPCARGHGVAVTRAGLCRSGGGAVRCRVCEVAGLCGCLSGVTGRASRGADAGGGVCRGAIEADPRVPCSPAPSGFDSRRRARDAACRGPGPPRYTEVLLRTGASQASRSSMLVATDSRRPPRRGRRAACASRTARISWPRCRRTRQPKRSTAGVARDHATTPGGRPDATVDAEPALVSYAATSFWRGRRMHVRSRGLDQRLLEEVAAAGATQVIVVSAVAPVPAAYVAGSANGPAQRLGDSRHGGAAARATPWRRTPAVRLGLPDYAGDNPIGPFDVRGATTRLGSPSGSVRADVARVRRRYHQFIEPSSARAGNSSFTRSQTLTTCGVCQQGSPFGA